MKNSPRTWIEIDSHAFNHNIHEIGNLIYPPTALGVVVKADAYGHGLEVIGKLCQENNTVSWLFTAGLSEAVRLRESGITKPILLLAYIDEDLQGYLDYNLTFIVADMHMAQMLSEIAWRCKKTIAVHIKIDTGMSRLGFRNDNTLAAIITDLLALPGLSIQGIFTHLADTNNSDYAFTTYQLKQFEAAIVCAESLVKKKLITHALASGALHLCRDYAYTIVRIGSNAYGYYKSPLQQQRFKAINSDSTLLPVLTWKTRIIDIKHINTGDSVSYHRTFIATNPMKIAILPIGYYDGYPRGLSHKGRVLIRGIYAAILGIISMNLMVVDISAIGSARIGDEVILCGNFPGLSADDIATVANSLQLEFLARISPRIPRILI